VRTFRAVSPVKTVDGIVPPGGTLQLGPASAAALLKLGAVEPVGVGLVGTAAASTKKASRRAGGKTAAMAPRDEA
jgi:hypothetical protein